MGFVVFIPPPGSGEACDAVADGAEVVAEDAATWVGGSRPSDEVVVVHLPVEPRPEVPLSDWGSSSVSMYWVGGMGMTMACAMRSPGWYSDSSPCMMMCTSPW